MRALVKLCVGVKRFQNFVRLRSRTRTLNAKRVPANYQNMLMSEPQNKKFDQPEGSRSMQMAKAHQLLPCL